MSLKQCQRCQLRIDGEIVHTDQGFFHRECWDEKRGVHPKNNFPALRQHPPVPDPEPDIEGPDYECRHSWVYDDTNGGYCEICGQNYGTEA